MGTTTLEYLSLEASALQPWCVQQEQRPIEFSWVEVDGPDEWTLWLRPGCGLSLFRSQQAYYLDEFSCDGTTTSVPGGGLFAPERVRVGESWSANFPGGSYEVAVGAFGECPGYKSEEGHYTCNRLDLTNAGGSTLPTTFMFAHNVGLMSVTLDPADAPYVRAPCPEDGVFP